MSTKESMKTYLGQQHQKAIQGLQQPDIPSRFKKLQCPHIYKQSIQDPRLRKSGIWFSRDVRNRNVIAFVL